MHRLESVTCPVKIGIHKNHPINSKVLPILFSMPKKSFIVEILVSGHFSHRLTMPPNIIYIFKCLCESNSKYHPKHVKGFDPATNMTDTASPTFVNVNIYLRWWNDLLSKLYLNAFKSELLDLWTLHFSPAGRSTTSTTTRWSSPCRSLSGRSGTIQDWGDDPIITVIIMAMINIKNMIDFFSDHCTPRFDSAGGKMKYLTMTDPKKVSLLNFHSANNIQQNSNCCFWSHSVKVWMPDTFFRNEKSGHFHNILVNNVYIRCTCWIEVM